MERIASVFPVYYFPPTSWYAAALREEALLLEVCQHYRKQEYSSRMYIKTANGIRPLVIPLGRKGNHIPLKDKRISYQEKWRLNHWRSLAYAYQNSPYFEYYADALKKLYETKPVFLLDFHLQALEIVHAQLGIELAIQQTRTYLPTHKYQRDYRQAFDPKRKVRPPWFEAIAYPQVFEGFEAELSILDLLFNEGPAARMLLKRLFRE